MGLKVLNNISKSVSIVGGGGDRYEEGTPCIAGHYYYDSDMHRYKCIKDTDGSIPLTNTTYFEPLSIDDEFGNINTNINGLESKRTLKTTTLVASGWSGGVYSFEPLYPSAQYDLEQIQSTGNESQLKAWGEAMVVGNPNGNTITCRGTVPTIDIPIMFYVRKK
jgi:hypothetical protein